MNLDVFLLPPLVIRYLTVSRVRIKKLDLPKRLDKSSHYLQSDFTSTSMIYDDS